MGFSSRVGGGGTRVRERGVWHRMCVCVSVYEWGGGGSVVGMPRGIGLYMGFSLRKREERCM